MVQLRDEDTQSQEPVVGVPVQANGVAASRESYMAYLKQQLEEFLPHHDKRQDDFINKLPNLLFLPTNANEEAKKLYDELCVKRARLIQLRQERVAITTWLWSFYREEMPHVTHLQCRERVKQLYAGKQRFYDTSKQVEEKLYTLHAIGW